MTARKARIAVALCLGLACAPANAQDCTFPEEAEGFAVMSLRARVLVDALHCRTPDAYNLFHARFGGELRLATQHVRAFYARTWPDNPGVAVDRWNIDIANRWSEHVMRSPDACGVAKRLSAELAAVSPGSPLTPVAERANEAVRDQLPQTCRAPADVPPPLRLP